MQIVYVVTKELDSKEGNAGWDVYQVYSDEQHAHEACAAFSERYPEWDFCYTAHNVIKPTKLKEKN